MPPTRRWIAHRSERSASAAAAWPSALRREVVAAFRRGTMDAERCLWTFWSQGDDSVLPPAAVAYLAWRAADDRGDDLDQFGPIDPDGFDALVEAGRLFFFPGDPGAG